MHVYNVLCVSACLIVCVSAHHSGMCSTMVISKLQSSSRVPREWFVGEKSGGRGLENLHLGLTRVGRGVRGGGLRGTGANRA